MGVKDLWNLLAGTGERIPLDHLATRRLAVDASIWITQFLKAMVDASGEVIPGAHLIVVFDGPAPALKRMTLAKRKTQRMLNQNKLSTAAERLLLKQLSIRQLGSLQRKVAGLMKAQRAAAAANAQQPPSDQDGTATAPPEDGNNAGILTHSDSLNTSSSSMDASDSLNTSNASVESKQSEDTTTVAPGEQVIDVSEDSDLDISNRLERHGIQRERRRTLLAKGKRRSFRVDGSSLMVLPNRTRWMSSSESSDDDDATTREPRRVIPADDEEEEEEEDEEGEESQRMEATERSDDNQSGSNYNHGGYEDTTEDSAPLGRRGRRPNLTTTSNPTDRTTDDAVLALALDEDEEVWRRIVRSAGTRVLQPEELAQLPLSVQFDVMEEQRDFLKREHDRRTFESMRVHARSNPQAFSEQQLGTFEKGIRLARTVDKLRKERLSSRTVGGVPLARIAADADREFVYLIKDKEEKRVKAQGGKVSETSSLIKSLFASKTAASDDATQPGDAQKQPVKRSEVLKQLRARKWKALAEDTTNSTIEGKRESTSMPGSSASKLQWVCPRCGYLGLSLIHCERCLAPVPAEMRVALAEANAAKLKAQAEANQVESFMEGPLDVRLLAAKEELKSSKLVTDKQVESSDAATTGDTKEIDATQTSATSLKTDPQISIKNEDGLASYKPVTRATLPANPHTTKDDFDPLAALSMADEEDEEGGMSMPLSSYGTSRGETSVDPLASLGLGDIIGDAKQTTHDRNAFGENEDDVSGEFSASSLYNDAQDPSAFIRFVQNSAQSPYGSSGSDFDTPVKAQTQSANPIRSRSEFYNIHADIAADELENELRRKDTDAMLLDDEAGLTSRNLNEEFDAQIVEDEMDFPENGYNGEPSTQEVVEDDLEAEEEEEDADDEQEEVAEDVEEEDDEEEEERRAEDEERSIEDARQEWLNLVQFRKSLASEFQAHDDNKQDGSQATSSIVIKEEVPQTTTDLAGPTPSQPHSQSSSEPSQSQLPSLVALTPPTSPTRAKPTAEPRGHQHPAFTERHPFLAPAVPSVDPLAGIDITESLLKEVEKQGDSEHLNALRELERLTTQHRAEAAALEEEVRARTKASGGVGAGAGSFGTSGAVTDVMVEECQALLRLMGVPYLVAPAEAEAQCAVLEELGYVDGVVTDDSDALIFGSKNVYRHMFERRRFVQLYRGSTIEHAIGLTREHLVAMTLLLGSDYTPGVRGIGKVNAIEVVSVFGPTLDGLEKFKNWVYSGERTKRPTLTAADLSPQLSENERSKRIKHYLFELFKYKHRHIRGSWGLSTHFPDPTVYQAYLNPVAERRPERLNFEWNRSVQEDDVALFMQRNLGWDVLSTRRLLEPVRKAAGSSNSMQSRILAYYGPTGRFVSGPNLLDVIADRLTEQDMALDEGPQTSGETMFGWENSALAKSKRVQAAVAVLKHPDSIDSLEAAVKYSHEAELEEIGNQFAETLVDPGSDDDENQPSNTSTTKRKRNPKARRSNGAQDKSQNQAEAEAGGESDVRTKRRRESSSVQSKSATRQKKVKLVHDEPMVPSLINSGEVSQPEP